MNNLKIIIGYYSPSHTLFEQFENRLLKQAKRISVELNLVQIIWLDSTKQSRLFYINQFKGQYVLFLDHDCTLTIEAFQWLLQLKKNKLEGNTVWLGLYSNPISSHYLQRVHNEIANRWLKKDLTQRILGGAFLVYSDKKFTEQQINDNFFWGGEDQHLALLLKNLNFNFKYEPALQIEHHTSFKLKHFIRRGFLHGANFNGQIRQEYKNPPAVNKGSSLWFSIDLLPGVIMHYFFFFLGRILGRILGIAHPVHRQ